jgi:hypothetical protein
MNPLGPLEGPLYRNTANRNRARHDDRDLPVRRAFDNHYAALTTGAEWMHSSSGRFDVMDDENATVSGKEVHGPSMKRERLSKQ